MRAFIFFILCCLLGAGLLSPSLGMAQTNAEASQAASTKEKKRRYSPLGWYISYDIEPLGFPFPSQKYAVGFSFSRWVELGIIRGNSNIGGIIAPIISGSQSASGIPLALSGLESRFFFNSHDNLVVRLKNLSIDADKLTQRERDFLEGVFPQGTITTDVLQFISIGIGTKWRARWGGTITLEYLNLEYTIGKPEGFPNLFNIGLLNFGFGFSL